MARGWAWLDKRPTIRPRMTPGGGVGADGSRLGRDRADFARGAKKEKKAKQREGYLARPRVRQSGSFPWGEDRAVLAAPETPAKS